MVAFLLSQTANPSELVAVVVLSLATGLLFAGCIWMFIRNPPRKKPRPEPFERMDDEFRSLLQYGRGIGLMFGYVTEGRRRFQVTATDRRVFAWLHMVADDRRLFRFRQDFRTIIELRPIAGLVACLDTPNVELRALAIWLLGRACGRLELRAMPVIAVLADDENVMVRRSTARALRRAGALVELQSVAQRDPDDSVRRLAGSLSAGRRDAYVNRLQRYVRHGGGEVARPGSFVSPMPVFIVQPIGPGALPKSRQWIRRLLEQIRELVHGARGVRGPRTRRRA